MIIYYIDGKKYTTDDWNEMSFDDISSPNENTPAIEYLKTGNKIWCLKGYILHRLIGPARIFSDGREEFCLNGKYYHTIYTWLKEHPNQDNAFQVEMLLKYT
jgi:hypothetical protein